MASPASRAGAARDVAGSSDRRLIAFSALAAIVLAYVARLVASETMVAVLADRLLMRWDLATHVVEGWVDYHLLVTGRLPQLAWDLWLQGYWPPLPSIYQIPFYLALGGGLRAALWSGLAAFVLTGMTGAWLLASDERTGGMVAASLFVALLAASPAILAYASVPMIEVLGAWVQLLVLLAYVRYLDRPAAATARVFAMSLTLLFFTKYNYFLLLAVPLVIYEETRGGPRRFFARAWRLLATPSGALLALYVCGLAIVARTGGFEFRVAGQPIGVHTIGNTGYVVLALLAARLWYLHRQRRIDWERLFASDPRVRPLVIWFVIPVAIWFASPYPNHIRDFYNLVFNRPLGPAGDQSGIAVYLDALRHSYFADQWVAAAVLAAAAAAAVGWRKQAPLIQCLLVAVPLQFGVIAFHQTRFPRFLLLTVVLTCLVAASEVARWLSVVLRPAVARAAAAMAILACAALAARAATGTGAFREIAFENYTHHDALRASIDGLRDEMTPGDRLVVVGQGNEVSPALLRWELGPPSGVECFPFEAGGVQGIDPALATRVLLLESVRPGYTVLDETAAYLAQRDRVRARLAAGALAPQREWEVPDRNVAFRLYARALDGAATASCR